MSFGMVPWIIAIISIITGNIKVYYRKYKRHGIMILGPPEVGKTTFIYQLENESPQAPDMTKTENIPLFHKTVQVGFGDKDARTIKTKDVPGEGYLNGMWWKVMKDVKPKGIIFMVDDRFSHPQMGQEQQFAFKMFIRMVSSSEYKKIIKPKDRVKVFMMVANKMDIWASDGNNIPIDRLLSIILPELQSLTDHGIVWNWCAMSAKYGKQVKYAYEWLIKRLEDKESWI